MDKNSNPFVSIIVNCFNGEKYLNEALKSLQNQTYNNWEVVFWDNQSTDSSAEIFKSYKDKRFNYYYSKSHTSLYEARNLAIKKSKGDFIAFLDTDDLWTKNKLELQVPYFENPKVGLVYSNFWLLKESSKKKKLNTNKRMPSGNVFNELINDYSIGILTAIIRKKFYFELKKKFDERFTIIGDFDLFLRLSKTCLFESVQIPLAFYRLHGKNFSTINKKKEVDELEIWLDENRSVLNISQTKKIQKDIDYRRFLNSKIDGNYAESIKILFNSSINLFNIKNLFLLLAPNIILKKLMWYYNDSN